MEKIWDLTYLFLWRSEFNLFIFSFSSKLIHFGLRKKVWWQDWSLVRSGRILVYECIYGFRYILVIFWMFLHGLKGFLFYQYLVFWGIVKLAKGSYINVTVVISDWRCAYSRNAISKAVGCWCFMTLLLHCKLLGHYFCLFYVFKIKFIEKDLS